jgi:hypothetical protein
MTNQLRTDQASKLFQGLKLKAKSVLPAFYDHDFLSGQQTIAEMHRIVAKEQEATTEADEAYLNDLYVLDKYVCFLATYGELWQKIINQEFADSWCSLQDALGLLRLLKRFSTIDINFFESQLTELEQVYPYNVFFSSGMVVAGLECSLCGFDIDSDECLHLRGQLYRGRMATAVVQKILRLDHVGLVTHPADKRCVMKYEDTAEQFKVIRHLSNLIISKRCHISDLWSVRFSNRRLPNPEYRKLGRNERCFCGSGAKFKKCCMANEYVEEEHVDIVGKPRSMDAAIA